MLHQVIGYRLQWHTRAARGRVIIICETGSGEAQRVQFEVSNAAELAGIGDILRNEAPVGFDPDTGLITTGDEPVGEAE